MYGIAYQIKSLNHDIEYEDLRNLVYYFNHKKCFPKLTTHEVDIIVNKVDKLISPEPMLNEERRFIFNPDFKLSRKEKAKIMNPILGLRRTEKTVSEIKDCLDNWDITTYGKVTIESLSKITKKNKKTITKYYKLFKPEIYNINSKISQKMRKKILYNTQIV